MMLSQIRKLQGSHYPASLFSLEPGIKGGSELSKQTEDLVQALESAHISVAAEDVITATAGEEGSMRDDSRNTEGVLNVAASTETREAGGPSDVETSDLLEPSKLEVHTSSTPGCTDLGSYQLNLYCCCPDFMCPGLP